MGFSWLVRANLGLGVKMVVGVGLKDGKTCLDCPDWNVLVFSGDLIIKSQPIIRVHCLNL